MTARRETFRRFTSHLNPAAHPKHAMAQGFYIESKNSISERLATRLELEPASTHMLVGGIGSGKTTELLRLQERLEQVADIRALFTDVLIRQERESLKDGVLLALAATAVSNALPGSDTESEKAKRAKKVIESLAIGHWYYPYHDPEPHDGTVFAPGILQPPSAPLELSRLEDALHELVTTAPFTPVMLFDGLDRLTDMSSFVQLVDADIARIKRAGVGVVVVAPQHARTWQHGAMSQYFDALHLHGASVARGDEGIDLLGRILITRVDNREFLSKALCHELARLSGGLVRDLLALARASIEEAYRADADVVVRRHVDVAADHFGRDLLVGISQEMSNRIRSVSPEQHPGIVDAELPSFVVETEVDVMLLLQRVIIEVPGAPVRYMIHPTVAPLLGRVRRRA